MVSICSLIQDGHSNHTLEASSDGFWEIAKHSSAPLIYLLTHRENYLGGVVILGELNATCFTMKFQITHGDFQIKKKKNNSLILFGAARALVKKMQEKWSEKVGQNSHLRWYWTAFIRNVKEKPCCQSWTASRAGAAESSRHNGWHAPLPRQGFPGSLSTSTCLSKEKKCVALKCPGVCYF